MTRLPRRWTPLLLTLPVLLYLGAFLIYPVGRSIVTALSSGGSGHWFGAFDPLVTQSILNSFFLGVVVTVVATAIGIGLALVMTRYRFVGKRLLTVLLFVPMILPPFVGAIGARRLLGRFGSVNLLLMDLGILQEPIDWLGGSGFWGVAVMEVLHLFPIAYLNIAAALANVDPAMEEAARSLGASPWRRFRTILLPLMMPGLFAGAAIVFIWAFTDLGTPLIFEYRNVVSVQIFRFVTEDVANPDGHLLVVTVLACTLLLFYASKLLLSRRGRPLATKGAGPMRTETPLGLVGSLLAIGFVGGIIMLGALPHLGVVLNATQEGWFMTTLPERYTLEHMENAVTHRLAALSIRNSITYSAASAMIDVALGVVVAWVVTRTRWFGRNLLDGICMLPLALPGLILAFSYVTAFQGTPLDPGPGRNPTVLLIIAYSIRRLPFVVRAAAAGFQQVPTSLEEASANLGASGWRTATRITGPLIAGNLAAGAIMAFTFAMLEVSDSLILASDEPFFPITKAIYIFSGRVVDGPYIASAMGLISMAVLLGGLLIAARLMGKSMGRLFRSG